MTSGHPPVAAIVLNWNGRDNTLACLDSLSATDYPALELIVVDNASTDNSVLAIGAAVPQAKMLRNEHNLGYAGGNNVGIAYALSGPAAYVLIINNDTRVHREFVHELVRAGEIHLRAGALIPKIYRWDDPKRIWAAGARWCRVPPRVKIIGLNAPDASVFDRSRELEYATGCAWLIRREALQTVDGLDSGYFMYQEDYDFCYRLREKGYTLRFVPTAKVWHQVSAGLGLRSAHWWYQWSRSVVRFYRIKNRFPAHWLVLFAGWVMLRELVKGDVRFAAPYLRGLRDGWRALEAEGSE